MVYGVWDTGGLHILVVLSFVADFFFFLFGDGFVLMLWLLKMHSSSVNSVVLHVCFLRM